MAVVVPALITVALLVPVGVASVGAASYGPTPSAAPSAVAAAAPRPLAWEGGQPLEATPRWWPRGRSQPSAAWAPGWPRPVRFPATRRGPLTGFVVALDPGHALGNGSHPTQVNRRYWVGLWKSCNTTGTATARGYPESSYTFDVVARLRRLLVAQGATVVVTRDRNTRSTWGPCVGARGALGAQVGADLLLSVHADGAPARGRGFHVIAPGYKRGYTDDHYRESRVLARSMIRGMRAGGMAPTTYLSSTLSVRTDVGSANTSDVPTVTVETLNMRNAADARIATSRAGRQKVAAALYRGIAAFLRAG